MQKMHITIFICCLLLVPCSLLCALDFSIRPQGFASIPYGPGNVAGSSSEDDNIRYGTGGGGGLGFDIDLSTVWPNPLGLGYTIGIEGAMLINTLQNDQQDNVSFYSIGGAAGFYFFPLSRLFTRLDGAVGLSLSTDGASRSGPGLFLRGGGEIGFRFTPGFTLAANTGWRQFENAGSPSNSGLYAGLTAQLTFQTRARREGAGAILDQYGEVYPVFMQLYQSNPVGSVLIRNNENAEMRNVRLSFRAPGYTASEFPSASVAIIPRGRSAQLPLYADFSSDILRFTDTGRIVGELVIRYTFLGQERETVRAVSIATHKRTMTASGDTAALAAFISPTSTETLDFARFIAGLSRANSRTGHNHNMQYAIWLLEGLRASNIRLGETYADEHEVQFPAETLTFRSGTARDLSLLFAAALEGVGISSALIQAASSDSIASGGQDFLVAVSLGIGQSAAETLFNGTERILIINNEVWLPLSMNAINEGFMAAWDEGIRILDGAFAQGREVDFVIVAEAWASYPPAPLPALGIELVRTDTDAATREVNAAMQAYITREIAPIIIRQTAIGTAAGQNRLGIVLARAGRIPEARAAYERAAGLGSVPAMTNRGNLALVERDFATAERWFRQALQRDSENRAAQRGIERIAGSR